MATTCRVMWNRLFHFSRNIRRLSVVTNRKFSNNHKTPYIISFSVFTWMGFKEKLSAEDDLINTIKHCVLFIQREEYEKAEQLLHVALNQAQQIRHELGITYIYDVMANLALQREQLDKAKKLFIVVTQRIMADGANEDDLRVVHLSAKLARVSHLKKEYATAQMGYEWCLEKLYKTAENDLNDSDKKLLAMTEDWYGRLCIDCNKWEYGIKLLMNSLNKMREISDVEKEHIVIQLNDIGTIYDHLGKPDESIQYFNEAIELSKDLNMDDLGAMYVNLGRAQ